MTRPAYVRWVFIFLLLSQTALAQEQKTEGTRSAHLSGFDVAAGQPFPAYGGLLIGFNIHDDSRISFGVGEAGRWTTYALDAKFFFSPDALSIYLGGGLSYMNGSEGKFLLWDFQFGNAVIPYISFGLDWTNEEGFHLGANLGISVPNGEVVVLPGVAIGWYF